MRPGEYFTGEVLDRDSGAGLTFYFVSYTDTPERPTLQQVVADLELSDFETVGPGRQLSPFDAVVQLLLSSAPEGEGLRPDQPVPQEIRDFAEYLLAEAVVPIRTNPLTLAKLGAILSGAGVGAGVGFVVAGGPTPLLAITIPAGILIGGATTIIGGAATGASRGLRDGLHYKIRKWMGVPDEWKPN